MVIVLDGEQQMSDTFKFLFEQKYVTAKLGLPLFTPLSCFLT